MKRWSAAFLLLGALLCAAVLLHCGGSEVVGRGGSEVVGKLVRIVNQDTVPVPGAAVSVYKDSLDTLKTPVLVETTDKNGNFVAHVPGKGTYFLFGRYKKDTLLVAYIPNVKVDSVAPDKKDPYSFNVGTHVLLPPGSVSGKVTVYSGQNDLILVDIPGLSYEAHTGNTGNFTIANIPPGKYLIRFSKDNFLPYIFLDSITIISGRDTALAPIELSLDPNLPPPAPLGLAGTPNTKSGKVELKWNSVPVSDLYGYIIARGIGSGLPVVLDTVLAPDTSYIDIVYSSSGDTLLKNIIYTVKSIDRTSSASVSPSSVTVQVQPPFTVKPVFQLTPNDTIIDYGGTVTRTCKVYCRVNFKVMVLQPGTASWTEIPYDGNGLATISFGTGNNSVWGRVAIRAASTADTIDTCFTVKIRPRSVAIISADSTDSSVTVRWNRSPDNDFSSYRLFYREPGNTTEFQVTRPRIIDTFYTLKTFTNGSRSFLVDVTDTEGLSSQRSPVKSAGIRNTPPRFTIDSSSLPDSAIVGNDYTFAIATTDKNNDMVFYPSVTPAGAAVQNGIFSWTPTLDQSGLQRFVVVASDSFGGSDTLIKSVYVIANAWQPGVQLNLPRSQFGIGLVGSQIFVVGGWGKTSITSGSEGPLATVVGLDTATLGPWTLKLAMANPRTAPMVAVWNGKLYALGGFSNSAYSVLPVEEYNPSAGTPWQTIAQMPFQRSNGAVCVIGNNLYCIGGMVHIPVEGEPGYYVAVKSINIFNLTTRVWTKGPNMHFSRADHNAVVYNGKIYIAGGVGGSLDSARTDSTILNSIEVYDPAGNQCTVMATQQLSPRCNFGMAAIGSNVYLVGGISVFTDMNGILSTVERVDVQTGAVDNAADLPKPRYNAQAIQINGRIYCIGGVDTDNKSIGDVMIYYP